MNDTDKISLNIYQDLAGTTDFITEEQFRQNHYYILGLNGEAAELLEKVLLIYNQYRRGVMPTYDMLKSAALELSDVCWYIVREIKALEGSPIDDHRPVDQNQIVLPYELKFDAEAILNAAINISVNAGQCADITKKMVRDNNNRFNDNTVQSLRGILYETISSCTVAASSLGFKFSQVLAWNVEKLASRMLRDKIHGSGDNR